MKKTILCMVVLFALSFAIATYAAEQRDLGEIIITATRIGQHDYKIAGNITVIDREQIEASNAQTIPAILKEALGVNVYDKSTSKSSVIDIRGFGDSAKSNILVLVNDRKINESDLSGSDLIQIPLEAVERIEIIRGAGSVLYGDNAVGGVVNIITKKGKGNLSGKIGATYGSYDSQGSDIEISGETKGFNYYLFSRYHDERGYRQNSDVLSKDFNARIGYELSNRADFDLEIGRHEDTTDLPSGLDESELQSLGRRGSANLADVTTTDDLFYKLGVDINPWPEDWDLGNIVLDVTFRQRDVFESFNEYNADRDAETFGLLAKYVFDRTIFDKEVNFVTGLDYYDVTNRIIGSGSNTDNVEISKSDIGLYGFAEYELIDDIFVNAGTRFFDAKYVFDDIGNTSYSTSTSNGWVSMAGVRYEYGNGSVLHFNIQETYRLLLTDEFYSTWSGLDTSLDGQDGKQFEVGLKHNFDDKVEVSITPYYMINSDEIFYNANTWSNDNYGKTKRLGVEIGEKIDVLKFLDVAFFDKFEVFANYTYQHAQFDEGSFDGNYIPLVPCNQINFGFSAQFLDHIKLSFINRYVGERYIINDLDNSMDKAKPYLVSDLKLSYGHDNFEVYVSVDNLFNKLYSPYQIKKTATTRDYYPAPEANFNLGMSLKF